MNRRTILAATLFVFGLAAQLALHAQEAAAQDQPAAAETPTSMIDALAQKLALSDDQKTQIEPILNDRRAKMTVLRNDQSMRRYQRMRQAKQIMEESDKKINAILTPDQQKQYAELEKQMREKARQRMQQGQGGLN
jgi:periplasmic protein CpxP/Spy